MAETIKDHTGIEKSDAVEFEHIKSALTAFQNTVLSLRNPDKLTLEEFEALGIAGNNLIDYGWPLARVLDLYYGMRPDAEKPQLDTESLAGLMVVTDAHNQAEMDMIYESGEEYKPVGEESFIMPFGRGNAVDIDRLLPPSHKRTPLPHIPQGK